MTKGQLVQKELKKVYAEIDSTQPHECFCCGRAGVPLTHMHLIRRSERKDLVTRKENIVLACFDCHKIYDDGDIVEVFKLKNIHYIMVVVALLDTLYFFRKFQKPISRLLDSKQDDITSQKLQNFRLLI